MRPLRLRGPEIALGGDTGGDLCDGPILEAAEHHWALFGWLRAGLALRRRSAFSDFDSTATLGVVYMARNSSARTPEAARELRERVEVEPDSLNAFLTVANPPNKARTRCIDIRYKWVMEQVQRGHLKAQHIAGLDMAADGLTKPLTRDKHINFVKMMGMVARKIPWAT